LPAHRAIAGLSPVQRLVAACSPLAVLDRLVPKDAGASLAVRDLAYGPHPRHRLDIYLPEPLDEAMRPPLLMFCPGGAWRGGSKAHCRFIGRAFAARGFVTAIPDHRLVPEVRFPDFVVDCGKALRAFRNAARSRTGSSGPLFLAGYAAGAYNAVMLGLDDGIAKAAGYPRHVIAGIAGIAGPYDFLPLEGAATRDAFAGVDDLAATQPVNLVTAEAPPMLLLAGSADTRVPPRNAEQLARRLQGAGGRAEVRHYRGLGHAGTLLSLARPFRARADIPGDISAHFHAIAAGGNRQPAGTGRGDKDPMGRPDDAPLG